MSELDGFDYIRGTGSAGWSVPSFMTDDEIQEHRDRVEAADARRIPLGFVAPRRKRLPMIGGRRAGTFPAVPRFDIPPR